MNFGIRTAGLLLVLFTASATLPAATIYSVSGINPFGGYFGQSTMDFGWSQSSTFTGVTIALPLADLTMGGPISGTEGTVYLTNQIGPGTTAANNVAVPTSVSGLSALFSPTTLFTGLTLGPGNYYLVLVPTVATATSNSMTSEGTSTPPLATTLAPGVADLGLGVSFSVAAFPPASPLSGPPPVPTNSFITVTGTAATPEPSTLVLAFTAIAGLLIRRHRLASAV